MYPISIIPPTHQVTDDFEVAYARAVRDYKRNLRLRRIQIVLRISLGLVLLGFLGIAVCLFCTLTSSCSTSSDPPTPRPTTQKTSTSPIITKTSNQPTTTTAITSEPSPTSKRSTTIQTTAITTSTSNSSSTSTSTSTSAYRPIPNYSGKTKL